MKRAAPEQTVVKGYRGHGVRSDNQIFDNHGSPYCRYGQEESADAVVRERQESER